MRPLLPTMIAVTVVAAAMTVLPVNVLALSLVPSGRNRIRIRPSAADTSNPLSSSPFPLSRILMESTIERTTSTSTNKNNDGSAGSGNLSPFLRNMVNDQRELQMNVGKAMDVLTNDYPYFLRRAPGKLSFSCAIKLS